jgi:hypothetical protein
MTLHKFFSLFDPHPIVTLLITEDLGNIVVKIRLKPSPGPLRL